MTPSSPSLNILFTPADFAALKPRDLRETVCVVFDVLRATSTMVTALANGAAAIIPVEDIPEALALRKERPEVLLAGERDGVRIPASLTGSIPFDLGNSPREFTREAIAGRTIVTTTTNGTRALRACARARLVLLGAFLNLRATADVIIEEAPPHLLLVCGGTREEAAYEDVLCAGALCDLLWAKFGRGKVADSVLMARKLYHLEKNDLSSAFSQTRNGARLMAIPELRGDLSFCAQHDILSLVARLGKEGQSAVCLFTGPSCP
jgi:2-phosphosulfolactate phosphatase